MSRGNQLLAAAGPFKGVRTVITAPYQDAADFLSYATDGYIRDAEGASSWTVRPDMFQPSGTQMGTGQRTQAAHAHTDPASGTIYRFFVVNGVLYRSNAAMSAFTVVTPVGIAIDTASTTRVGFLSVGSSLVVTDGVNRPWVMSNFAATPVTGAYIDIDGAGGAWTAFGPPTIYQDSVFFITATVPGGSAVQARVGVVWSEPNQPTVGYTQSGYADFWNFIETGSDPLYAIIGTNSGLFLWRENSITVAAGTPSVNFSSTATRDARGDGVGTISPWTVAIFQNNIFFLDSQERVWMMPLSDEPVPVWKQAILPGSGRVPSSLTAYAIGAIVPELNQYIVAFQEPVFSGTSPVTASVYSGDGGAYAGEWVLDQSVVGFDFLGQMRDSDGLSCFVICGGNALGIPGSSGGYVWQMYHLDNAQWASRPSVTTKPLGYSADSLMNIDRIVVITGSSSTVILSLVTPAGGVTTLSAIPVSPTSGFQQSYAQEYRSVFYLDGSVARSVVLTFLVLTTTVQWGVQRVELYGERCKAGPEDP